MEQITFTDKISVQLVQQMGGDHMVVAAAKVSTSGVDALQWATKENVEGSKGLINYLMKQRHGSAFEHSSLTFFVHAPIFVWREFHRHRVGFSFNESSARYSKMEAIFWIPPRQRKIKPVEGFKAARPEFQAGDDETYNWLVEDLKEGYRDAYSRYENRLSKGIAREVARAGLPVGIYSSCWVTCNPRSLMHFLSLRTHDKTAKYVSYPQAEIEIAAKAIEEVFKVGWPITHQAFIDNGRVSP